MSRKQRAKPKKHQTKAPPRPETTPLRSPDWPVVILAGAGLLITGYLTVATMTGTGAAFCAEGSGCDIVQSSRWSTLLGLPIALWGFAVYALIAGCAWAMPPRLKRWRRLAFLSVIGFAVSAWLTVVGIVYLDAVCAWCLASFAVITAILVTVLLRRPDTAPGMAWSTWSANNVLTALIVVVALHVWQTDLLRPESPRLKALAEHLDETGARFYGAYWCPACQEQKRSFGSSADRLPYVECTPEGRGGPRASACLEHDIERYPTWIIDGRRITGVIPPEELARYSGHQW
jgi:uncharacterized membrane protein